MAVSGYSRLHINLHWLTALLIVLQYAFHDGVANAFETGLDTGTFSLSYPVVLHFITGSLILILMFIRFGIRRERGVPPPPEGEPALFQKLGHIAHLAMYGLVLLLALSGAVAWGTGSEGPGEAHEVFRALLFFLILAHIGAVIVHQFVWKTRLLMRMMRPED